MSKQITSILRTNKQNEILNLEKKYLEILEEVFTSKKFIDDLLLIEKEIRENYPKFKNTWNLKNKIKVPAERLVRHHVYTQLHELIAGVYPSPVSSDLGIKTKECVICIDVKTVDTVGNSTDIRSTQVEPNQISFQNSNHTYIQTVSNLESIDHYSRLPVLTYVIKIIYTDDNYSFKLSRGQSPSLVLTCIPNGELSNLFDNDIIKSFKTYDYYTENDKSCYAAKPIPQTSNTVKKRREYVESYCVDVLKFTKMIIETDNRTKNAYFDAKNRVIWWETSHENKPVIRAVKSGSTARLSNDILEERYDSSNIYWCGYKVLSIPKPL